MKNSGVFTIFSPLVLTLALAMSWTAPFWFYLALAIGTILSFGSCYLFYPSGPDGRYWKISLPAVFYFLATAAYVTVSSSQAMSLLILFLLFFLLADYLRASYYMINEKSSFSAQERWSSAALAINLLSFFWGTAALFGLQSMISLSYPTVIISFSLIFFLLGRQWLNGKEISKENIKAISWMSGFLGLGVSFLLAILPFAHYVLALIGLVIYHFSLQLSWRYVSQSLSSRRRKTYLAAGILSLAVLVLGAHWL